jgi:hypothetical protein
VLSYDNTIHVLFLLLFQEYLHNTHAIPKGFSESGPNMMWHGVSHGIFAFPWLTLRDEIRKYGMLSDTARDECSLMNCCCWEQHSGMLMDWSAAGTFELREAWYKGLEAKNIGGDIEEEYSNPKRVYELFDKLTNETGTLQVLDILSL